DEEEEDSHLIPSIPIEAKWNIVKLMDANLDSDTDEEQIIILEPKEKEEGKENPLEIWISDYSTSSNSYALTWKGVLSIESGETLNITVNESPMQGRYEIYILGYDSRDYHTMDMFFPQSEESPQYRNIFSQSVKGTIELYSPQIAGSSLSDDYGTRVRISPQIIVTQADENSSNPLDSVITTWELTQSPPRYKVVSTKKIRATKEQEEMILGLINGPVENFEAILSDYWYKEEGENGFIRMINLSGDEKTVELLTLQNFEQLIWTSSYKSSYAARLYIYGTSKYISSVREKIVIDMVDRDSINLSIYDNGSQNRNLSWSGKYKRMTEGMKLSLIKEYVREINMKEYDLKGKYKSATGEEISFDNSSFTLTQEGKSEVQSGYFTLFVLNGEQLMELIFYDERGIKKKQEQYLFSYAMEDDREHRIRSIQLIPGETDAHGFIPSSDERERRFEQIELLSD
ncbi:MAG: pallilysin-related adhesin, partial [Spirochaetales bacterium]|nr:pallilysin-related adhesin [Spirochaetales bacterium]